MKALLTAEQLAAGVGRMAQDLSATYGSGPLVTVGVLTGCFVFLTDLIRHLPMRMRLGFVQAKSYRSTATRPGELTIDWATLPELGGQDVLLVDDILDTGHTLARLIEELKKHNPRSLRSAVLLRKQSRQEVGIQPDFVGFEIPDQFVVGYGLDYDGHYRNLPYLAVLEEADLNHHRCDAGQLQQPSAGPTGEPSPPAADPSSGLSKESPAASSTASPAGSSTRSSTGPLGNAAEDLFPGSAEEPDG